MVRVRRGVFVATWRAASRSSNPASRLGSSSLYMVFGII